MEQKPDRFYPSAPLEKVIDLERRLEKHLNDVNSFKNSNNKNKGMTAHFRDKDN